MKDNVDIYSLVVLLIFSTAKGVFLSFISIFCLKLFMLDAKVLHNDASLDLNNSFHFQTITYSVPLSSFRSHI